MRCLPTWHVFFWGNEREREGDRKTNNWVVLCYYYWLTRTYSITLTRDNPNLSCWLGSGLCSPNGTWTWWSVIPCGTHFGCLDRMRFNPRLVVFFSSERGKRDHPRILFLFLFPLNFWKNYTTGLESCWYTSSLTLAPIDPSGHLLSGGLFVGKYLREPSHFHHLAPTRHEKKKNC